MNVHRTILFLLAAVSFCGCAAPARVLLSPEVMEALPANTPWRCLVDVGGGIRVRFAFEKSTKGNGMLYFPGGGARIYDAHDDGIIFEPSGLDTRLVDLNHDGYLDWEVSGTAVRFEEQGNRELERRRVRAVFRFVPATKIFTNAVSDPWIYTDPDQSLEEEEGETEGSERGTDPVLLAPFSLPAYRAQIEPVFSGPLLPVLPDGATPENDNPAQE